jgi:cytidylate kinase
VRFPEAITLVAIIGPTLSGKTTIARELGILSGAVVRHCGEIFKQQKRVLPANASQDLIGRLHREVDEETLAFARVRQVLSIIEGRYLDSVLSRLNDVSGICFVRLDCPIEERARRFVSRQPLVISASDAAAAVRAQDAEDMEFRFAQYGDIQTPDLRIARINTAGMDVTTCCLQIMRACKSTP